jgi:phage terminase small subunit
MSEPPKLTDKQRLFVHEYLIDYNATQSAIRAGYSKDTAGSIGHELLKKPEIAEALETLKTERLANAGVTAERVIAELAKLAFSDVRKVVNWDNSVTVKPSADIDDSAAAAISSVTSTANGLSIRMHDKRGPLTDLAKLMGLMKDNIVVDHTGEIRVKTLNDFYANPTEAETKSEPEPGAS